MYLSLINQPVIPKMLQLLMTKNLLMGKKNKWIALDADKKTIIAAANTIEELSQKIGQKENNQKITFLNVPPANTHLSL